MACSFVAAAKLQASMPGRSNQLTITSRVSTGTDCATVTFCSTGSWLRTPTSDLTLKCFFPTQYEQRKWANALVIRAASGHKPVSAATLVLERPKLQTIAPGFVEEMRAVSMKMHTKAQAKEGQKEPDFKPFGNWEHSIPSYLRFLVSSKLVYETLEGIVATNPAYEIFRNTGLERTKRLANDLAWLKSEGHMIPEPTAAGIIYANYLKKVSEENAPSFICHFYNIYYAHSAGGLHIGRKVSELILSGRTLQLYQWDGDLRKLLSDVKDKLNAVAREWTANDKERCLDETAIAFTHAGKLLRLIEATTPY